MCSSDLILCIVDKQYLNNGNIKPLSELEINRIKLELKQSQVNLDINLIVIEDGRSIGQSKGGTETLNILKYTYHLHKQVYPLDFDIKHVSVTIFDKLRAISKFMLDYLEDIAIDYKSLRLEKQQIYQLGITEMIKYSTGLIKHFNFTEVRTKDRKSTRLNSSH